MGRMEVEGERGLIEGVRSMLTPSMDYQGTSFESTLRSGFQLTDVISNVKIIS